MDKIESTNCIFIRTMRVMVRVGLLDHEREMPQALDVTAEVFTNSAYLDRALNGDFIDYAALHACIKTWEKRTHTNLLEELAMDLFETGFALNHIEAMRICIAKPDIFPETQSAGIDLTLTQTDWLARKK